MHHYKAISFRIVWKTYPWKTHLGLLLPLAVLSLFLVWTYGFWGASAEQSFRLLRTEFPHMTRIMQAITDWGNPFLDSLYALILLHALRSGNRSGIRFSLAYAFVAILFLGVVLQLVKYGLGIPRPGIPWPSQPWTSYAYSSFPSGHTAHVLVAAIPLAFWFRSRPLSGLLALLMALTGFSRIWLGWHHPGDLLGSLVLGSMGTIALYWILVSVDPARWYCVTRHSPVSAAAGGRA